MLLLQFFKKIESIVWGNNGVAAVRAVLKSTINKKNEQLIQSYYPSLAVAPTIYILEEIEGKDQFI